MYHKHNTEGIVLRGFESGEASRNISLFTREFGLIHASVQNARSLNSKLRYSVQDFTEGQFTLVRGKNSWKLVGAKADKNFFNILNLTPNSKEKVATAARVFSLLGKIGGEEKSENIYETLNQFLKSLIESPTDTSEFEQIKKAEYLAVLKVLKELGLLKETEAEIGEVVLDSKKAVRLINESLESM